MRFVQLLLTDEQAELTAAALRDAEEALKELRIELGGFETTSEEVARSEGLAEDIAQLGRLSMLFQDMSENPSKYTPTGKMAATVRSIVKRTKGPSQPPSRRKRRAGRHQRRRTQRHEARRDREYVELYNAAMKRTDEERQEYEAELAAITERTETQPKYTITDGFGNVLMSGIPAEFITGEDGESLLGPKIEIVR